MAGISEQRSRRIDLMLDTASNAAARCTSSRPAAWNFMLQFAPMRCETAEWHNSDQFSSRSNPTCEMVLCIKFNQFTKALRYFSTNVFFIA
jgi:hypothetical protein